MRHSNTMVHISGFVNFFQSSLMFPSYKDQITAVLMVSRCFATDGVEW